MIGICSSCNRNSLIRNKSYMLCGTCYEINRKMSFRNKCAVCGLIKPKTSSYCEKCKNEIIYKKRICVICNKPTRRSWKGLCHNCNEKVRRGTLLYSGIHKTSSIYIPYKKVNIKYPIRNWTEDELLFLKNNYKNSDVTLEGRTKNSISQMARKLDIKKYKKQKINKEKIKKEYNCKNCFIRLNQYRVYCENCSKIVFKEKIKLYNNIYYQNNKRIVQDRSNKYKNIYNKTIRGKLDNNLSRSINRCLGGNKNYIKWTRIVGYNLDELKNHLEKQFLEGMSWELYLSGKIQIDHRIPKSYFKYETYDSEEFKLCWELDNLKPMWKKENNCKSNSFHEPTKKQLKNPIILEIIRRSEN